jgi:hypothetical protein
MTMISARICLHALKLAIAAAVLILTPQFSYAQIHPAQEALYFKAANPASESWGIWQALRRMYRFSGECV